MTPSLIQLLVKRVQSESPNFFKKIRIIAMVIMILFGCIWVVTSLFLKPFIDATVSATLINGSKYITTGIFGFWSATFMGTTDTNLAQDKIDKDSEQKQ